MKSMTVDEAKDWFLQTGLRLTKENVLRYKPSRERRFFVSAPEEFRRIMPFTRNILTFRGEAAFSGGLIWLRRWNIGTPQFIKVGWKIIEDIRRAHGDLRSLELAPAQLFRDDELLELHAFLVQIIGFWWVAEFVPPTGGFFVHFKDNRQVCFMSESTESLAELRAAFGQWNPTDNDPMVERLAELEKARPRGRIVRQ
jgi:hypothetical protein